MRFFYEGKFSTWSTFFSSVPCVFYYKRNFKDGYVLKILRRLCHFRHSAITVLRQRIREKYSL